MTTRLLLGRMTIPVRFTLSWSRCAGLAVDGFEGAGYACPLQESTSSCHRPCRETPEVAIQVRQTAALPASKMRLLPILSYWLGISLALSDVRIQFGA